MTDRPEFRGPWELGYIVTLIDDSWVYELEWHRWLKSGFCRFGPTIPAKMVNGKVVPA